MATTFYNLKVADVRRETPDTVSIAFEIPNDIKPHFEYKQGQYLTLETEIAGERVRRSYSLCSSPLEEEWRVAIKKVEGGKFSTFANEQIQVGQFLSVMPPMGKFYTELNPNQAKSYLLFAAGSGITPILSIAKTILKTEPLSTVTLIYGNKHYGSIIFKEVIDDLKDQFLNRLEVHHILSREKSVFGLFQGRIDAPKCQLICKHLVDIERADEVFICGPEQMILEVRDTLLSLGKSAKNIHVELFGTTGITKQKVNEQQQRLDKVDSLVKVIIDGNVVEFEMNQYSENILDAAMQAGADVPYACKGGVCCTCRAKVIEGKAEMAVNYALDPEEVEEGFILTCQARPATKNIVVDYDVL